MAEKKTDAPKNGASVKAIRFCSDYPPCVGLSGEPLDKSAVPLHIRAALDVLTEENGEQSA